MKARYAATFGIPLVGLIAIVTAQYRVVLLLLPVWGCIIMFATYNRWPLMVGEEDEDRWYTTFTLNHRFVKESIGNNRFIVLNYAWGAFTIALAVISLRVLTI